MKREKKKKEEKNKKTKKEWAYITDKGNYLIDKGTYGVFYTPQGKFLRFADYDELVYLLGGYPRYFSYSGYFGTFNEYFGEEPIEAKLKKKVKVDISNFEEKLPDRDYFFEVANSNSGVVLYENYYGEKKEIRYY